MRRAEDRMDFPTSAERRTFQPASCGRANSDVAALHNAGLCCIAAMDIIAAVAGFVGYWPAGDHAKAYDGYGS